MSHTSERMTGLFLTRVTELLAGGERLALCTILRMAGSAPRGTGAQMLLHPSGEQIGSVGGGLLEGRAIVWGAEILARGGAVCRRFVLTAAEAGGDGMVCGGEVELLLERLDGTCAETAGLFAAARDLVVRGEPGCLVVALEEDGEGLRVTRLLFSRGRRVAALPAGGRPLPAGLIPDFLSGPRLVERGGVRYFLEPLAPPIRVVVCGAGHIAVRLAPLCHLVGFQTLVLDDRAEFANPQRFPAPGQVQVVPSYARALEGLGLEPDDYVVVVTRGHAGDLEAVRQALRGRPGYIGMIGSRRKREAVFAALAGDGWGADDLSRVICPVGLPIGAETPEEIALSIVAQLVATRAAGAPAA